MRAPLWGALLLYNNVIGLFMEIKRELYNRALAVVLDAFGITETEMFTSNREACVQARVALVRKLSQYMSDGDIALLTPLRRCSICCIKNRYQGDKEPWSVRKCVELLNKIE